MERLDGRGIAITGGTGDIGAAMGAELRRLGAAITLISRKTTEEAELWLEQARQHEDVSHVPADVRSPKAIDAALSAIDPLDVAIGNAAVVHSISFLGITLAQGVDGGSSLFQFAEDDGESGEGPSSPKRLPSPPTPTPGSDRREGSPLGGACSLLPAPRGEGLGMRGRCPG